ncbi:dihydrouridine synthase-domain-containing protein [Mycotypha africana]|uniref:dihydrouridine synthase-domain-containing protein n=1 Tax=Mycotypha africana TaxID=64632 RepID=UPI0023010D45|nr:dihydrouridine synthase-domain-containing protein [Mycotypha africana]KAI8967754.1 dihydrouridine synthase-domain-containing protein [Mycotypha africana]
MVDITSPPFLELLHIISGMERFTYYTEMVHSNAILKHEPHLERFIGKPRGNVVVQLGGSDPKNMALATKILQDQGYAEVNINNGCPSPNVQHGSFGAVLMKTPTIMNDMFNEMHKANVTIPVTVKCRIGVDDQEDLAFLVDYVKTLISNNKKPPIHFIVHARKCILKGLTPKQNRSIPPLNYERVYELAKIFPDLIITINGGFTTTHDIQNALQLVDGCMIGRKVMNDPLFLQEIEQSIYRKHKIKPTEEIINEYLNYAENLYFLSEQQTTEYGLPPLSLLLKPLMSIYKGKKGRIFRQHLQQLLSATTKASIGDLSSIVLQSISHTNTVMNMQQSLSRPSSVQSTSIKLERGVTI